MASYGKGSLYFIARRLTLQLSVFRGAQSSASAQDLVGVVHRISPGVEAAWTGAGGAAGAGDTFASVFRFFRPCSATAVTPPEPRAPASSQVAKLVAQTGHMIGLL
jgi:hypothetical protein